MENRSGLIYLIWLKGPRWTRWQKEGSHRLEAFNTEPTRGQCLPGHPSEGNTDPWGLTYETEAFSEQDRSLKGVGKVSSPLVHLPGQRELNDNLQRSGILVVPFSLQAGCGGLHRAARWRPELGAQLLPLAPGRVRLHGAGPEAVPPEGVGPADPQPVQLERAAQQVHSGDVLNHCYPA